MASTIRSTFEQLHQRHRIGLMPFIPAGYPNIEMTGPALAALAEGGANLIEVGIPFSDPIADGPTIQQAFTEALAKKLRLADIFSAVRAARASIKIPLVAMGSYSIVYRYGIDRYIKDAKAAGFDGLILPDLPPPEARAICRRVQDGGLDTILLIAPTTAPHRRAEIAALCSGFVYYLSVSGITGERDKLPEDIERNIREIKNLTDVPVCVGFGISKPRHVAQLAAMADGAIVGSAMVKCMRQHAPQGPAAVATALRDYCRELLSEVPQ